MTDHQADNLQAASPPAPCGYKKRARHDWPAILAGAKARGLTYTSLARELGMGRGQVYNAARQHAVVLGSQRLQIIQTSAAEWAARFRATPAASVTLNDFCRAHGCSPGYAKLRARQRGLVFLASNAETSPRKRIKRW